MENYCQNCKKLNLPEAQFCKFCASPLAPSPQGGRGAQAQNQGYYQNQQWNQGFQGGQQMAGGGFAPQSKSSGRAIASLLLSVAGLLLCCALTSVPGAILGWMEVNAIKQGRSSPTGMTMAQIGFWGGIVASIINLLFYGFYFLALMSGGMYGGGMYY